MKTTVKDAVRHCVYPGLKWCEEKGWPNIQVSRKKDRLVFRLTCPFCGKNTVTTARYLNPKKETNCQNKKCGALFGKNGISYKRRFSMFLIKFKATAGKNSICLGNPKK
jgi:hypothetical protein